MADVREAVHPDPVWRDRSDFIIAANIDPGSTGVTTEQLWARRIDDEHHEICCIPFFVHDLALGDIVAVDADHLVTGVTEPSGRYVFRIHFGRSDQPREEVTERLSGMGALTEWSSRSLVAVDAENKRLAQQVADFLQEREDEGHLMYETGKSS